MKAGSSVWPRKAQVKDKGLGAESWDFGLVALEVFTLVTDLLPQALVQDFPILHGCGA
jgi:hypothetical protein